MRDTTDKPKNQNRSQDGRSQSERSDSGRFKSQRRKSSRKSKGPSILQQAINIGMSIYANRDSFINKTQKVLAQVYETEQGLNLEQVMDKVTAFGRMAKAVFKGEYKEISPLFLIKIGFAVAYYRYGEDFIPDDGRFISIADDLVVAAWAIKSLVDEIEKFEAWEGDEAHQSQEEGSTEDGKSTELQAA